MSDFLKIKTKDNINISSNAKKEVQINDSTPFISVDMDKIIGRSY